MTDGLAPFVHVIACKPFWNPVNTHRMTTENGHPQRLTSLAERTQQLASESYTAVKQRLPEAVKPRVEKLEEAVGSAAAPYVHRAQDTGARPALQQCKLCTRSGPFPKPEPRAKAIWRQRRDCRLPAHRPSGDGLPASSHNWQCCALSDLGLCLRTLFILGDRLLSTSAT